MGKIVRHGRMPQEMQDKLAEQGWIIVTGNLFKGLSEATSEKTNQQNANTDKNEDGEFQDKNKNDVPSN